MARNVEIKARLENIERQIELAKAVSGTEATVLQQTDVFFNCTRGRLKLRIFADGQGELIFYTRPNQEGPKLSEYQLVKTPDPPAICNALTMAYGESAVVQKTRLLFFSGRTRIHLDKVEGLGDFLELEVVLQDGEDESAGEAECNELMEKLEVARADLIETAYVDLLMTAGAGK